MFTLNHLLADVTVKSVQDIQTSTADVLPRNDLKQRCVGPFGLQLIGLSRIHRRALDVSQSHHVVSDLLNLRPVDHTRQPRGWRDLLKNLLPRSWGSREAKTLAVTRWFLRRLTSSVDYDLPGTIVNDVPGGYWVPRVAIRSLLFVNCWEVTMKPLNKKERGVGVSTWDVSFWFLLFNHPKYPSYTWLLTITGCGVTVVGEGEAFFTVLAGTFSGSTIGEGPAVAWIGATFFCCVPALFLRRGAGQELLSFWLPAVRKCKTACSLSEDVTQTFTKNTMTHTISWASFLRLREPVYSPLWKQDQVRYEVSTFNDDLGPLCTLMDAKRKF